MIKHTRLFCGFQLILHLPSVLQCFVDLTLSYDSILAQ